ncbi:hypothetical protein HanXRQr2_Chr15g0704521 [Helianthus annuus]|uniref:Uncharacterized protein n=1 Tax=Helianthus annuus TaxID=4232 RepID=A0A251SAJ1_HELAN|nr:hypothetical protein HanXRQr2_Chr15g0704521 [Helianthus annuus]KAJ0473921.1 hypothetical protein HanHA89_Chr15g0623841 [Helianthus annuus]KAJ0649493.1 hypothetical protein HanLR1_Chr15g0584901 [Helianthus annuus]KAJ0832209.1 hypothetical protein HanPSC8_Chr15g0676121 [Helianthus annuus]
MSHGQLSCPVPFRCGSGRDKFFAAMGRGEYHTPILFLGKWTAMRTKINNFNNIHNGFVNNYTRRSCSSDVDIMAVAHNEYRMYHGHPFMMIPS